MPTRAQSALAIGPTVGLPQALHRAFNPTHDFQPIPPHGPNDWLFNHPEPGQTYEQFLDSRADRPDARRNDSIFSRSEFLADPIARP